ncbi:hypothetical protein ABVT39_012943 [Epinephelus coioides]
MGAVMMHVYLVAASLCVCGAAPISDSLEVLRTPVSVYRGYTATLPCWLNPPQNAEGLEVHWYRGGDSLILFYRGKKFEDTSQEASYVGRVSFGLKDAASGGLATGDVSLKLKNVTIEDAGEYTCYVSSDQSYDRATVSLQVIAMGAPPLLSAVWKEDNMLNMSCESQGWYPQPSLRWSDQKQDLPPKSLKYSKDSSGLLSVQSWVLVSSSTEVSCSVGVTDKEAKEARVHLGSPPQPESGSSVGGWVAFALLLMAVLALLGVLYFRRRGKKAKSGSDHAEENTKLLSEEDILKASKHYVNVTLDKAGNNNLRIKDGHMLRDAGGTFSQVTCLTAIKGTPGFSSGEHYWEVSLWKANVGVKQSWWVGVTSEAVIPQEPDFTPTTSNGFWFLSSSPGEANTLQFSTQPQVVLPIYSRPQTVGVYLNYGKGELSFYNVEDKSLIGSLKATFTNEVFPVFNPGTGDMAPMEILQKTEQGQSSDKGNSVGSTAQEN